MRFLVYCLFIAFTSYSQVGIGTLPSTSSLLELNSNNQTFVLPRMTNAEMLAISAPIIGSLIYNTTHDTPYLYKSNGWSDLSLKPNSSLILKKSGGLLATSLTNYYNLPLDNSHIKHIDTKTYTVIPDNKIQILETGVYTISAELSVTDLRAGFRNYSLALYKNGVFSCFLNKNGTSQSVKDWWGTTGIIVQTLNANDVIEIKYFIQNNSNLTISFTGINLVKFN